MEGNNPRPKDRLGGIGRSRKQVHFRKWLRVSLLFGMIITGVVGGWFYGARTTTSNNIKKEEQLASAAIVSFEECKKQEKAVLLKTIPEQCSIGGRTYTGPIADSGSGNLNDSVKNLGAEKACRAKFKADGNAVATDPATLFYADFNNDKNQDVVVGIVLEGNSKNGKFCVYTSENNALKLLYAVSNEDTLSFGRPESLDSSAFRYKGAKNYLGAGTSIDTTYTYRWDGKTFVKENTQ